jgi:hypothetical protein
MLCEEKRLRCCLLYLFELLPHVDPAPFPVRPLAQHISFILKECFILKYSHMDFSLKNKGFHHGMLFAFFQDQEQDKKVALYEESLVGSPPGKDSGWNELFNQRR